MPDSNNIPQKPCVEEGRVYPIAFDSVFFQYISTGIARFWVSILTEWSSSGFICNLVILDRGGCAPYIDGAHYFSIPAHDYNNLEQDRKMLDAACSLTKSKLFISSYYSHPGNVESLLVIYDMIPEVLGWEVTPPWEEKKLAIKHAKYFAAISSNSAKDLTRFHSDIKFNEICLTYCATSSEFFPKDDEKIHHFKMKYGIRRPYYILVGSDGGYKNIQLFYEAFKRLPNSENYDVLRAVRGTSAFVSDFFRECCYGSTIHSHIFEDFELATAYSGAVSLIYPSQYEGFGMPPLEAMASGCPAIVCPNSSIPEVCGESAIYVPSDDPNALAAELLKLQNNQYRVPFVKSGLERAKLFNWAKSAKALSTKVLECLKI